MNIGLIAHDAKKKLMQNFCIAYRGILCKNDLYATGTTGRLIEEVTNINIHSGTFRRCPAVRGADISKRDRSGDLLKRSVDKKSTRTGCCPDSTAL